MTTAQTVICCGKPLQLKKETNYVFYHCQTCRKKGRGKTAAEALKAFVQSAPAPPDANLPALPTRPAELRPWVRAHFGELQKTSAAFIDKPATARMFEKNTDYVMSLTTLAACWETEEGQRSVISALKDSFNYGAVMPDMGSVVAYGGIAIFIPAIEAFDFALTTGRNAPFKWIAIEPIFEHDKRKPVTRINGNFCLEFTDIPSARGEVVSVAVYAYDIVREIVIGDIFEADRLIKKAAEHSKAYRYYLQDVAACDAARTENGIGVENGREYFEKITENENGDKYFAQDVAAFREAEKNKTLKKDNRGEYCENELPKKGGGTWTKKIYRKDIENPSVKTKRIYVDSLINPYAGADRPEMLRKMAGKSYFWPWLKKRNSLAMAGEWSEADIAAMDEADDETIINDVFNTAKQQVQPEPEAEDPNIIDAEYEEVSAEDQDQDQVAQDQDQADYKGRESKNIDKNIDDRI